MIISKAPSSSGRARRSASTPPFWRSPLITGSTRATVGVARGNEKGRVERAIRYIRDNFFAARPFTDIEDLNAQAMIWCAGPAADRPCPGEGMSVREAFALEASRLAPLPDNPFPPLSIGAQN